MSWESKKPYKPNKNSIGYAIKYKFNENTFWVHKIYASLSGLKSKISGNSSYSKVEIFIYKMPENNLVGISFEGFDVISLLYYMSPEIANEYIDKYGNYFDEL